MGINVEKQSRNGKLKSSYGKELVAARVHSLYQFNKILLKNEKQQDTLSQQTSFFAYSRLNITVMLFDMR